MTRKRAPMAIVRKNMKDNSQAKPNSGGLFNAPMSDSTAPKTIRTAGSFRQPDKSSGGGKSCFVCGVMSFQGGLLCGRQIIRRTEPAQLQRTQISDGSPAVLCRHQRAICGHRAFPVGN